MRTCFIHIGTHKTATTSLQRTFSRHAGDLLRHNYVYPRTGRPPEAPHGHHNLAWELSGDRRFRPEVGTVADLLVETRDSRRDVILSSEDFECSVFGAGFDGFVRMLQANRFAVRVIVYLRNQVDYAPSLYLTMLMFGVPASFDAYLTEIVDNGRFCWQESICAFCYRSLLERFERLDAVTLDVRSYDRPGHGSVIEDHLALLGLDAATLGIDASIRENRRIALVDSLRLFCQNGKGAPLDALEQQAITDLGASLGTGQFRIEDASRRRIADRFRESNAYVRTAYGIDLTGGEDAIGDDNDAPSMETLFSADFGHRVDRRTNLLRQQHHDAGARD